MSGTVRIGEIVDFFCRPLCGECVCAAQHRKGCGGGHPAAWLGRRQQGGPTARADFPEFFLPRHCSPKTAKPPRVVTKSPCVSCISRIHSCVLRPAFFRLKESQRAGFHNSGRQPFVIDDSQTNNFRYSNRLWLSPALFNAILTFD